MAHQFVQIAGLSHGSVALCNGCNKGNSDPTIQTPCPNAAQGVMVAEDYRSILQEELAACEKRSEFSGTFGSVNSTVFGKLLTAMIVRKLPALPVGESVAEGSPFHDVKRFEWIRKEDDMKPEYMQHLHDIFGYKVVDKETPHQEKDGIAIENVSNIGNLLRISVSEVEGPRGNTDVLIAPADTLATDDRLATPIVAFELKTTSKLKVEFLQSQRQADMECIALNQASSIDDKISPFVVLTDLDEYLEIITLGVDHGKRVIKREVFRHLERGFEVVHEMIGLAFNQIQEVRAKGLSDELKFDIPDVPYQSARRMSWVGDATVSPDDEPGDAERLLDWNECDADLRREMKRCYYQEMRSAFLRSQQLPPFGIYS